MKIGVFDSGIGGQSVADTIAHALPDAEVLFRNDAAHVPYGTRPMSEVYNFVVPILEKLVEDGAAVIVIACNTVSTNLIAELREHFSIPLIALEPMVKPAAQLTITGTIAVCATPATLTSRRYAWLKDTYAPDVSILEPDCANWARLIEQSAMHEARIRDVVGPALEAGADVIVLGCTHYHWIEQEIKTISGGRATVLQPEQAVLSQLKTVLQQLA